MEECLKFSFSHTLITVYLKDTQKLHFIKIFHSDYKEDN